MQRTLFVIPVPEQILGLPVVGVGWLLILWAVFCIVWIALLVRKHGFNNETLGHFPLFIVVAAAIVFVLPILRVEEAGQVGFPVRGYGVMLVLGIVSGVGLAAHRAQRMGLNPEVIYSLAMVLIISGVVGARVFFVLQYWDNFYVPGNWPATFGQIFRVTEGGIVVYGALIGASLAFAVFCYRRHIPALALADLIAPSLLLGMFFGRLGCFMNGCCYGGLCTLPLAVQFPQGEAPQFTPPFVRHLENGAFYGFLVQETPQHQIIVGKILDNSPASASQLREGDVILGINGYEMTERVDSETGKRKPPLEVARDVLITSWDMRSSPAGQLSLEIEGKEIVRLAVSEFPDRSLRVHPTQVYSSINGAILCLTVLAFYPLRKHDGEVIALTLGLYSVTRFLLEVIRTDEYAIGGTGLTISQNVSVVVLVAACMLFVAVRLWRQPLAWPRTAE